MARTTVATDDFNRADGPLGSNWSQTRNVSWGPASISSNAVSSSLNAVNYAVYKWVGAGTQNADQYGTIQLTTLGFNGADHLAGIALRVGSGTDASANFYAYIVIDDGNPNRTHNIFKVVAGTYTLLTTASLPFASGDILGFSAIGTALQGFRNGSTTINTTDSSHASGSFGFAVAGGIIRPDNFEGGNEGGGGGGGSAVAKMVQQLRAR